ncbi:glycosyltransferase family 2 protein [Alkalicoccobacillus porphyridii]|uniref:glycosyltransferase family 2 protein n=1 Tax=Alkalicoccobacillus porphyridii TaxID=2597270 RepID=UPI0021B1406E|nr:glycosyltransferase family 2 protein [Alkalicoccobacillus porphyridii]
MVKLSVLIVTKNEENYIARLLEDLLNQTIEKQLYEIIVVDGMSTDTTVKKVKLYLESHSQTVKLLTNPKQTLPPGWNIGIKEARGDYIMRVDGHTSIPKDFLEKYLELLEKHPEVDCVGGIIESKGSGFQGTINQYVFSHQFGVGNSKFRTTTGIWEGFVDTVPYGAYKRKVFDEVGYFTEGLKRNEDIEFHKRMKDKGMQFYMSTSIKSTYYVRPTLKGVIKKSLGDGTWNIIADQSVKGSLRNRHKAPLIAFLMGLLVLLGSFFFSPFRWVLGVVIFLYFTAATIASVGLVKQQGVKYLIPTVCTFFCLHFFRGLGNFLAFFKKEFWRFRWNRRKR